MKPDLNNDDFWEYTKTIVREMYLRHFSSFDLSRDSMTFREFKVFDGTSLRISSNGYYQVSYENQSRSGHISDLVGTTIPDTPDFKLPSSLFSENDNDRDITKRWDEDSRSPLSPLSPFNSGAMPSTRDLMSMPREQVEYYARRMRDMRKYNNDISRMSPTEFNDLYMGSWDNVEPSPSLKEFPISNLPPMFKLNKDAVYEDQLIFNTEDINQGVDNMGNMENDSNNQSTGTNDTKTGNGWHEPVIKYDPNWVKPQEEIEIPPRFPKYAQDTLLGIYTDIGRTEWGPGRPPLIGPNSRTRNEIAGETFIHPSWLEVARVPIHNKDYMVNSFIPTLRRKLEYERIVLERKLFLERKYPSNDLFNEFIAVRFKSALKRDKNPDIKRKAILSDAKNLLKNAGFIYMHIHEEMVGAATLAKNIMLTLPEESRDQLTIYQKVVKKYFDHVLNNKNDVSKAHLILAESPPTFTVKGYIDFEASSYPKYMGEEMTSYYAKIKSNPTDMIYQIMKHNVDMLSNIIKGMPGYAHLESNVYIVNPIEWALDFIRYATECLEYYAAAKDLDQIFMRDLVADPIYEPLPLRMAVNIAIKFPYDLEFGALPAEIIDSYESRLGTKTLMKKELWDGLTFMISVRDLPWRNQIASQLWDTTFYCSTLVEKMNRKADHIGQVYKNDPYTEDHTRQIYSNFEGLNRRIVAGKDAYTDNNRPLIGRKEDADTHDRMGWYLSFYNQSKMEGL